MQKRLAIQYAAFASFAAPLYRFTPTNELLEFPGVARLPLIWKPVAEMSAGMVLQANEMTFLLPPGFLQVDGAGVFPEAEDGEPADSVVFPKPVMVMNRILELRDLRFTLT